MGDPNSSPDLGPTLEGAVAATHLPTPMSGDERNAFNQGKIEAERALANTHPDNNLHEVVRRTSDTEHANEASEIAKRKNPDAFELGVAVQTYRLRRARKSEAPKEDPRKVV